MTACGASFVGAGLLLLATLISAPPADAGDPTTNSEPHLIKACGTGVTTFSDACLAGAFSDFNAARAKEGLGELRLPSNFRLLTTAQQLFVLTDIDRVDRGLVPIAGLSSELNTYAQVGADTHADPNFPAGGGYSQGGSNWASTKDPLWSEFLWMYADGPGSGNLDCVDPATRAAGATATTSSVPTARRRSWVPRSGPPATPSCSSAATLAATPVTS